jgi:hypothetical protein
MALTFAPAGEGAAALRLVWCRGKVGTPPPNRTRMNAEPPSIPWKIATTPDTQPDVRRPLSVDVADLHAVQAEHCNRVRIVLVLRLRHELDWLAGQRHYRLRASVVPLAFGKSIPTTARVSSCMFEI